MKRFIYRIKKIIWVFSNLKKVSFVVDNYMSNNDIVIGDFPYHWDGLYTKHNCDFINNKRFSEAYQFGKSTESWGKDRDVYWRAYVACWFADYVKNLEGDFVECGVNRGGLSRTIVEFINFKETEKKFYLLDTFLGLVDEYISIEEKAKGINSGDSYEKYKDVDCYKSVVESFKGFNVDIIKGKVPDTLPLVDVDKICYISLDMNCTFPEIAAAEFFWDKLVPGGVMVLDDYGWKGHEELKEAYDKFAFKRNVSILSLPTAQGIIIKPR